MSAPTTPLSVKLSAAFGATSLALALVAGYLVLTKPKAQLGGDFNLQAALDADPELRQQVIEQLAVSGGGHWDSHNDADVARVMRPKVVSDRGEVVYKANRFGMREREYRMPKQPNTVRVVLLGDSFVYGNGAVQENRFGVHLERFLEERAGNSRLKPEVLHIGISSWNIISECSFLRRQLSLMQPDLVLHLIVTNDLDDTAGSRGFGAFASFTPQFRGRADGIIQMRHPEYRMNLGTTNHLLRAFDFESRDRYARSGEAIRRLTDALGKMGTPYVLSSRWPGIQDHVPRKLAPFLQPEQFAFFSTEAVMDKRWWLAENDPHWNDAGQEWAAKLYYGLILERSLLPQLQLEPWEEAEAIRADVFDAGESEAINPRNRDVFKVRPVSEEVDLADMQASAAQFNGGIDEDGMVSPYASLLLRNVRNGTLRIEGKTLDRPELDGAEVTVFADERHLGTFTIQSGQPVDASWNLPKQVRDREFISVRLQSNDYVYVGDLLDHCVVFELTRVSIAE